MNAGELTEAVASGRSLGDLLEAAVSFLIVDFKQTPSN